MHMGAVIFDMDGVIINSEPVHIRAKLETFRHYGLTFDRQELEQYAGRTSHDLFSDVLAKNKRTDIPLQEVCRYKQERYLAEFTKGNVPVIKGTKELIMALHAAKISLALATSSHERVMHIVLKQLDLEKYFTSCISGSTLVASKPDPAIYILSAQKLHVSPAECLVIEDAAAGVIAAKRAGMQVLAYHNPDSGAQDLSLADFVVQDMITAKKLLLE